MDEDCWLKVVAEELMLHETQLDALITVAFPGQLEVSAAEALAAGACAMDLSLRRRLRADSPEEPRDSRRFWFRSSRQ